MAESDVFIVAVPTPVDDDRKPDFGPVKGAGNDIGPLLKPGNIVCFESTVYPGATEEICAPLLEKTSGLKCGKDFWLGYSPERMNPGDPVHTLANIVKAVAGQTPEVGKVLAEVYGSVTKAGVFMARDIATAEAAKVIENAQRDINIAFINDLTKIFNRLCLSIYDVLDAANTKWRHRAGEPYDRLHRVLRQPPRRVHWQVADRQIQAMLPRVAVHHVCDASTSRRGQKAHTFAAGAPYGHSLPLRTPIIDEPREGLHHALRVGSESLQRRRVRAPHERGGELSAEGRSNIDHVEARRHARPPQRRRAEVVHVVGEQVVEAPLRQGLLQARNLNETGAAGPQGIPQCTQETADVEQVLQHLARNHRVVWCAWCPHATTQIGRVNGQPFAFSETAKTGGRLDAGYLEPAAMQTLQECAVPAANLENPAGRKAHGGSELPSQPVEVPEEPGRRTDFHLVVFIEVVRHRAAELHHAAFGAR